MKFDEMIASVDNVLVRTALKQAYELGVSDGRIQILEERMKELEAAHSLLSKLI